MIDFTLIRNAIIDCTSYDLQGIYDSEEEHQYYALIDPYGEQDGDLFEDLEDVVDYVSNNSQIEEYLNEALNGEEN